ncbi:MULTISPECIES: hypothetical protein [unclassified Bradyrhizobium]|uniref:XkdW family protein n=1 Tax=unclassified Bradyrhizobium TaxID=2631580 RepID=UPI001BA86746|nr:MULTISPECIES: hypothetical protein [unclassified Bradyrhizobium]MBR1206608.1 hypothetical protein [Bradyrhizobium sp. AUGA SZCCT0124]MBR1315414.1 hypothetical protein [Bradyrhizobium sp. AUGA SZCCT0051]MBR1338524.1 hypothetical protein [Bradyrhizobium sp. AUGA SZCCT0105]MBR1356179.1 hypothetical protein [Bradyrhizobium sp. AUGA SZCCT0045]
MYRPEQFVDAILSLCSGLQPRIDFDVTNDGDGPVISGWYRTDVAQPTQAQIEAVDTDALQDPATVLPQDLMAQFTAADAAKIQAAIAGNVSFWLLWQAFTTQRDPMVVSNDRFKQGWAGLVSILGQARMNAIASALGVSALSG